MTTSLEPRFAATRLWSAAASLSPRIQRLRDQYWSFYDRAYTNEVRAFSTGAPVTVAANSDGTVPGGFGSAGGTGPPLYRLLYTLR